MIIRSKNGIFKPKAYSTSCQSSKVEPSSVSAALADPKWRKAMTEEYRALMHNNTWELVNPEHSIKIIGSKWIFKIKCNIDGSVNRYKARLVAKGYHQTLGINYTETFSHVVKSSTIQVILSLAAMNKWVLRQIDINNAFFNGHLIEAVYMQQSVGFVHPQKPHHVCMLQRHCIGLSKPLVHGLIS